MRERSRNTLRNFTMSLKGLQGATFQSWYLFDYKEKTSRTNFGRNRRNNWIRGFYLVFTTGFAQHQASEKQLEDRENRNHTDRTGRIKGQLVKQKLPDEEVRIFLRRWYKVLRKQRIKGGFDIEQAGSVVQINKKVLWITLPWWRIQQNPGLFIFSTISVLDISWKKSVHKKCIWWVRDDDAVLRIVRQGRVDFGQGGKRNHPLVQDIWSGEHDRHQDQWRRGNPYRAIYVDHIRNWPDGGLCAFLLWL